MKGMKRLQIGLLALAAVALMASDATAQTGGRFLLEGRAGYQLVAGDMADYLDPGPTFGLAAGFGLGNKITLWLSGDYAIMDGSQTTQGSQTLPNWKVGTVMGWFGVNLISGIDEQPDLIALFGAGASNWNVVEGNPNNPGFDDTTVATVAAQLKFLYWTSDRFAIHLSGQAAYAFTDFKTTDGEELVKGTMYFPFSAGFIFAL
jgi:hypothetical protein